MIQVPKSLLGLSLTQGTFGQGNPLQRGGWQRLAVRPHKLETLQFSFSLLPPPVDSQKASKAFQGAESKACRLFTAYHRKAKAASPRRCQEKLFTATAKKNPVRLQGIIPQTM